MLTSEGGTWPSAATAIAAAVARSTTIGAAATRSRARESPGARTTSVTVMPPCNPSCQLPPGELGDLAGRPGDLHARSFQRLSLRGSRALGPRDDRPSVPHALAGRRLEPRDVGDDRLRAVIDDVCRGPLLVVAADLPRHDDQVGTGVGFERRQRLDEPHAVHRIASHADARRLADVVLGELVHDLVDERARPAHEPDTTRR